MLAAALVAMAVPAAAQDLVDGSKVDDIVTLARGYGAAELEDQPGGAPRIAGNIKGVPVLRVLHELRLGRHGLRGPQLLRGLCRGEADHGRAQRLESRQALRQRLCSTPTSTRRSSST